MDKFLNTVILGDCLEVMKQLPDKSIDLVLTDPPYGIGIANNPFRQKFEKDSWDDEVPTQEYFDEIFRVSKEQVIFGGNYFNLPPSQGFFIWDKKQPKDFSSSMCEYAWSSRQAPARLYSEWVVQVQKFHPTTKPTGLMEFVLSFFPEAKIILDPFAGSGTTGVACKNLKRNFILIEKEPKYVEIINKRLEATTGLLF